MKPNAPLITSYKLIRQEKPSQKWCHGALLKVEFELSDGTIFTEENNGFGLSQRYFFTLNDEQFKNYFEKRLKNAPCGYTASFNNQAYINNESVGQWEVKRYVSELDWHSKMWSTPEQAIKAESQRFIEEQQSKIERSKEALNRPYKLEK